MASLLKDNTNTINKLLTTINNLPNALIIDTTLSQSGQAADAKAVGDALANKAASTHTQAASTITSGTFAGKVQGNTTAMGTISNAQFRDIYAGTEDLTAGTSTLATGTLYFVYE